MKLAIYLTVCMFTTVHAVPDQTWNAITKVEKMQQSMEKRFDEIHHNYKDEEDGMEKRLKENNDEMEKRFNEMATRMQTMEQKIDELQSENSELRNQMQKLGAEASSSLISFTASMTSGQFVPGGDDIIPFDTAISNPGGHFIVTTYKFICPSDNLQAGTDYDNCGGRLVMDGATVIEAMGIHYDANFRDIKQVSNSVVMFCTEDSEVYVTAPWPGTGIYGYNDRTTFSGFIL